MTDTNWAFSRSKLLRIANIGEETLDRFLKTRIIPSPEKILWLDPPSEENSFPGYVLGDILHLKYLEASKVSTLWELQKFTLGAYGEVKYEADLKRLCGELPYREIHSDKEGACEILCRMAEESLSSQRIISATFRPERVDDRKYLVLSRVVLEPKSGFFRVELVQSDAKDSQRILTDVFRTISGGELP